MTHMTTLLDEWRAATESESRNSNRSQLILTMDVPYSPYNFPIESIRRNLNWVHVMAYDYHMPKSENYTGAHAALYDPASERNTDYGMNAWINSGLSANKLVLCLPFYGYAWTLVNPNNNAIGAPARGPAETEDGAMSYKGIRGYIQRHGAVSMYNATYVVNYCTVESTWIGYDDVEVVKIKVAYAKRRSLRGYVVWRVDHDDNWVLSEAAQQDEEDHQNKLRLLLIIMLPTTAVVIVLLSSIWYLRRRLPKTKESKRGTTIEAAESSDGPNLQVFGFGDIKAATKNFSLENKLGEGGYGPVYKAILRDGQEIAVKRLSKTSTQGIAEFKNEVMVTAKLQHVNLVRVLGFCTERGEKMLIYEYMPKKSLDFYIYGQEF